MNDRQKDFVAALMEFTMNTNALIKQFTDAANEINHKFNQRMAEIEAEAEADGEKILH